MFWYLLHTLKSCQFSLTNILCRGKILIYILNKTVKPILFKLTLPITGITLGLFYFVNNMIILKVRFVFLCGKKELIENKIRFLKAERSKKQPIRDHSAGSVFKNINNVTLIAETGVFPPTFPVSPFTKK